MVINLRNHNRNRLPISQKEFLIKVIPWAWDISDRIIDYAMLLRKPIKNTILPQLVLADILIESKWGEHPISQPLLDKKYSNNLSLLVVDDIWEGKDQLFEGTKYKAFKDYNHFASGYADWIIYNRNLSPILDSKDLETQLSILASMKSNPSLFMAKAETIIEFYDLESLYKN
jgi:DNA mismatch repair ATPase MutS